MAETIGDYLNQLESKGELTKLFRAGIIGDKWATMRNVYNYFDATNNQTATCQQFGISRATFYRYLSVLNEKI